jgi:hypothetical protein
MVPPPEWIDFDGLRLLEVRIDGAVIRLTDTAEYVLDLSDSADDPAVTVVLEKGLLWAAVDVGDTGPVLQVRHDAATLRMSSATVLVDVTVPATGATQRLSANEATALRASGAAMEVLEITPTEVAADPWASANLRLDEQRTPYPVIVEDEDDVDEAVVDDPTLDDTDDTDDAAGSPSTAILPIASEPSRVPPKTSWQLMLFVAVAVLITGVIVALVFHVVRSDGSKSTATTTSRGAGSVTTVAATPSSAVVQTSTTTSLAVRAAPSVLNSCRQLQPGTLLVSGQASDPTGRARRYRVQVALASETGAQLTTATRVLTARPLGRATPWTIPLPVGNLSGRKTSCQLISVDALPN